MGDLNDNRLAAIVRGEDAPSANDISDIAAELLRARKHARGDSRRGVQVRRLRWAVENLIVKVEMWFESAPASNEQLLSALGRLGARLDDVQKEVRALPLELGELLTDEVIAKWLRSDKLLNAIEARDWGDIPDELATRIDRGEWKEALRG